MKTNFYYKIRSVGALTFKMKAFKSRHWEERSNISLDTLDSLGTRIIITKNNFKIKRIQSSGSFLFNLQRFNYEIFQKWKIIIPLKQENCKWIHSSWRKIFIFFNLKIWFYSQYFKTKNFILYTNTYIDKECILSVKLITKLMGFTIYQNKIFKLNNFYFWYINPNFYKKLNTKKIYIFIGLNIRLENPILNIKFRLLSIKNLINIALIGSNYNDVFNCTLIGLTTKSLLKLLEGKNLYCIYLKKKRKLSMILGNNIIERIDASNLLNSVRVFSEKPTKNSIKFLNKGLLQGWTENYIWKNNLKTRKKSIQSNLVIVYLNLNYYAIEELNLNNNIHEIKKNIINKENNIYILLGLEKLKIKKRKKNFIVFQGSNINLKQLNILAIDLIWPTLSPFDKSSNFLNMEGKIQKTTKIKEVYGFCYNDWYILNALYLHIMYFTVELYKSFKYSTVKKLPNFYFRRFFANLTKKQVLHFYIKKISVNFYYKELSKFTLYNYNKNLNIIQKSKFCIIYNNIIKVLRYNPYKLYTDYSRTLKNCSRQLETWLKNYI